MKGFRRKIALFLAGVLASAALVTYSPQSNSAYAANTSTTTQTSTAEAANAYAVNVAYSAILEVIPAYSGEAYTVVNGNVPTFTAVELTTVSFETYSALDTLGRAGIAYANIGTDLMPTEERESISSVKPTGWQSVTYDIVDGGYLYNRCHLIGYQLTAENANEQNLITGTRYLNVEGMLPFENLVADFVEETGYHVLYRVTPIYDGDNLVASGVLMEALSVEDGGAGISFCIYCYNVQPGIVIDYATGNSALNETEAAVIAAQQAASGTADSSSTGTSSSSSSLASASVSGSTEATTDAANTTEATVWIPTNGGTKYHSNSSCSNMKNPQQVTLSQALAAGYTACKKCY